MNKWTEILLGLVIVVGLIWVSWMSYAYNWTVLGKDLDLIHSAWIFLKGGIFWLVFMIGALFILLGINDLKE